MIKSRPIYAPFQIDPSGRTHLVVTDLAKLPDHIAVPEIETWTVETVAPGIAAPAGGMVRAFRSVADLLMHLQHRLGREAAGFRLYALGKEAFLWDVMNVGRGAGLGRGEVFLTQLGSLKRRVYCTHCKTMIEDVTTNIVTCPECRANLFVRDHFSRRLAAFMGVIVDAEVPGEIPPIEEAYAAWHE
jgi:predicted RNA-binding Zn-ribbon protein involved in translation (DUF1610 family)